MSLVLAAPPPALGAARRRRVPRRGPRTRRSPPGPQGHLPVLADRVVELIVEGGRSGRAPLLVDGTVGAGGHALALLEAFPEAELLGLDRDPAALANARERLAPHAGRVRLAHASFADLAEVLAAAGLGPPDGVLLDLGLSSLQLDDPARGFSFDAAEASADMRLDPGSGGPTALELANRARQEDLARWLREFGQEPRARAVARAIVRSRPHRSAGDLARAARRAAARGRRHDPATLTFQALRMAVNDELGHLGRALAALLGPAGAPGALAPRGRLVVIAFHSGEDRLVKEALRGAAREGRGRPLTRKPVRPGEEEVRANPRARSARLRAWEAAP